MTSKRKTWQEKLADKAGLPKFVKLEKGFPCYNAVHKMGAEVGDDIVMVNPSEVIELMRKIPYGQITTVIEICKAIAKKHDAKGCCSLTTGIFIMTIANAVEEAKRENRTMDIPYWRTLKADGFLNEKFPGGAGAHKEYLEQENFSVKSKGKRFFVENYQAYLFTGL
jgi:alkylated DNA nucleotide flippase Atl1